MTTIDFITGLFCRIDDPMQSQGNRAMWGVDRRLIMRVTERSGSDGENGCGPNGSTRARILPTCLIRAASRGISCTHCMIF